MYERALLCKKYSRTWERIGSNTRAKAMATDAPLLKEVGRQSPGGASAGDSDFNLHSKVACKFMHWGWRRWKTSENNLNLREMRWIYIGLLLFFHIIWVTPKCLYLILFDLFLPSIGWVSSQYICFFRVSSQVPRVWEQCSINCRNDSILYVRYFLFYCLLWKTFII